MEKKSPIRIIAPGRVYRSDAVDATHSPLFHQIEGLVVDKDIRMSDLKGILELFAKKLYGDDTVVRFRLYEFLPLRNHRKWIFSAISATVRAAAGAARAGLKFWAAAWLSVCSGSLRH